MPKYVDGKGPNNPQYLLHPRLVARCKFCSWKHPSTCAAGELPRLLLRLCPHLHLSQTVPSFFNHKQILYVDSSLQVCDNMLLGKWCSLDCLIPEDEGSTILQNAANHSLNYTSSHLSRLQILRNMAVRKSYKSLVFVSATRAHHFRKLPAVCTIGTTGTYILLSMIHLREGLNVIGIFLQLPHCCQSLWYNWPNVQSLQSNTMH